MNPIEYLHNLYTNNQPIFDLTPEVCGERLLVSSLPHTKRIKTIEYEVIQNEPLYLINYYKKLKHITMPIELYRTIVSTANSDYIDSLIGEIFKSNTYNARMYRLKFLIDLLIEYSHYITAADLTIRYYGARVPELEHKISNSMQVIEYYDKVYPSEYLRKLIDEAGGISLAVYGMHVLNNPSKKCQETVLRNPKSLVNYIQSKNINHENIFDFFPDIERSTVKESVAEAWAVCTVDTKFSEDIGLGICAYCRGKKNLPLEFGVTTRFNVLYMKMYGKYYILPNPKYDDSPSVLSQIRYATKQFHGYVNKTVGGRTDIALGVPYNTMKAIYKANHFRYALQFIKDNYENVILNPNEANVHIRNYGRSDYHRYSLNIFKLISKRI